MITAMLVICWSWTLPLGLVPAASERVPGSESVLALAPADAAAIAYVRDAGTLLAHPLLGVLPDEPRRAMDRLREAWEATFDGPAMVAVRVLLPNVFTSFGVTFATRAPQDAAALRESLQSRLVPAIREVTRGAIDLQIGSDGQLTTLMLTGPGLPPMLFYLTVQDGQVFADTDPRRVGRFMEGQAPADRFVDSTDFTRLPEPAELADGHGDLFLHVNLRGVMPMLRPVAEQAVPGLFDYLGLGSVESLSWSTRWQDGLRRYAMNIGLADETVAWARWLVPDSGPMNIPAVVPADWLSLTVHRWKSAADTLDTIFAALDRVDPDIAREYREEAAEWNRQLGFDAHSQMLSNLVDEWAVAVTVDVENEPAVALVFKLADPDVFLAQFQRLIDAFRLPISTQTYLDVAITSRADGDMPRISLAILDGRLVVARDVAEVAAFIDAHHDGKTWGQDPVANRLHPLVADGAGRLLMFNVADLFRRLDATALASLPGSAESLRAIIRRLAESDARMIGAVRHGQGAVTLDIAANEDLGTIMPELLAGVVMPSIVRATDLSRRAVSLANVHVITTAGSIHAQNHKGQWPETVSELLNQGIITSQQCQSPYGLQGFGSPESNASCFYLFRGGFDVDDIKDPSSFAVVAEPTVVHGAGANFGFADGHSEWVREPNASELLAELRAAIDR